MTLSNDNGDLEIPSLRHSVDERKGAVMETGDMVARQLRLPLLHTWPQVWSVAVVLWVDDDAGVARAEERVNIPPTPAFVDAQRDDEELVGIRTETKAARRSATANREHMSPIDFAPCSSVTAAPDRLLDDVEESVCVGLVDLRSDRVDHPKGM